MKKILLGILLMGFHLLLFSQSNDSLLLLNKQKLSPTKDSSTPFTLDDKKESLDSLKKQNFLNNRINKVKGWSKPKKAAMLSLVLPGAGQIYNKKGAWWRLPLCYGAYGYTIYYHIQARNNYFFIKTIYEMRAKNEILPVGEKLYGRTVASAYQNVSLQALFNDKRKYQEPYERSYIWLGAAHLFCVADAFVSAHLNAFDINEDISLKVQPKYDWNTQKPMLGLALRF